ncbi:biotin-dependent carboxyltransferase family protein [Rhodocytophaga rosea]|uniref:Biotin-dependent carboxyltransferase family protein n=1 Tax=Rhodocytophaga rosea TaxID=2704465 RepID=A0A6C0GGY7_9BACT|nr:biotin-dependent carboxyltransferase family protein [Rhodocytophaga rosea]QHT67258.1 biotin-dependent carboxyltransferase family protein [Rhodocytophaga rosea]
MSLEIIRPGLLTTVQDTGRYHFRKQGIIVSGAMDTFALRIGNLLVGNSEEEAALEITFAGPEIRFTQPHLIAITGTLGTTYINNEPVSLWKPVFVPKDSVLTFGLPRTGCRAYLTIAGGLDVPKVMGSYATYMRAKMGGWFGRPLQAGDILPCKEPTGYTHKLNNLVKTDAQPYVQATWGFASRYYPAITHEPVIRVMRGPEYDHLPEQSKADLWNKSFQVSTQSDRMGFRLQGSKLALNNPVELISSAVTFGTIQLPPDGNPIILMADHQTTGGYPRIAQVISADLSILAQVLPQQTIRFKEISLTDAQQLYYQQESIIRQVREAIKLRIKQAQL